MTTDFSSLDKLVEFGLGIGIATQMMNTMNHVIANTAYPGVGINPGVTTAACAPAAASQLYIVYDGRVAGPLDSKELSDLVAKGFVAKDTFCWQPGMSGWKFASDIPEVNKYLLLNQD